MSPSVVIKKKQFSKGRKELVSKNAYLASLVSLFERIEGKSSNDMIRKIAARLKMSRNNRPPLKVSKLAEFNKKTPTNTCVVVSKILDDETVLELPAMNVIALQFSKSAKDKIEKFGGKVYTLDKLFEVCPGMENVSLFRGKITARKVYKYFGAAGDKRSKTYPKGAKGKNGEKRLIK